MISVSRGDTNSSVGGRETAFHCTEGKLEEFQSMSAQYALKIQKQYKTKRNNIVGPTRHSEGKTSFINEIIIKIVFLLDL